MSDLHSPKYGITRSGAEWNAVMVLVRMFIMAKREGPHIATPLSHKPLPPSLCHMTMFEDVCTMFSLLEQHVKTGHKRPFLSFEHKDQW